jgi:hypothetical protein
MDPKSAASEVVEPTTAKPEVPEMESLLEYKDEHGRGLKLYPDGTVKSIGYEADKVSLEIYSVILTQLLLLSQLQQTLQQGIKADLRGQLKLVVAIDDASLEHVEMFKESLLRANRAFVLDQRRRAGQK